MSNLDFFKMQAKNFLKDWRTRRLVNSEYGINQYEYDSNFFDVASFFLFSEFFDTDDTISLMKAQHLIAKMVGFERWDDLIHASDKELLLAEILLRHFYKYNDVWDWESTLIFADKEMSNIDEKIDYARMYYDDYVTGEKSGFKIIKPKLSDIELHEIKLAKAKPAFDGLKLTSKVFCPLCYQEFQFKEADVITDSQSKELFVCCKNSDCDGDAYTFIYDSSVDDGRVELDPFFDKDSI